MAALHVDIPEKLKPLLLPAPYKIVHGGRGGAKSWSVATIKTVTCAFREHRLLCAREIQRSLRESVHQLMKDRIKALRLEGYLNPLDTEIRGIKNDSQVMYAGLQAHTATSIKSYEGVDAVWVEEAQAVPKRSWDILIPTIRKPGSEIWATANLELESDYFTQHFVRDPPSGAIVIEVNWSDNPWWTDEMDAKRLDAKRKMDPDDYDNIWEGKAKGTVKGAIFGKQVKALRALGRIGPVEPRKRLALNAFLDLGSSVGNATAVWLHQHYGTAHLFVKYIAKEGEGLAYFWDEMEKFRLKHNLRWGTIYMPHDGAANLQGAELVNRIEVMESLAAAAKVPVTVQAVTRTTDLGMAIEATRTRMMDAWIDEGECEEGIKALEHYRFRWSEEEQRFSRQPAHTWASNGADAFRQWAQGYEPEEAPPDSRTGYERQDGLYIRGSY